MVLWLGEPAVVLSGFAFVAGGPGVALDCESEWGLLPFLGFSADADPWAGFYGVWLTFPRKVYVKWALGGGGAVVGFVDGEGLAEFAGAVGEVVAGLAASALLHEVLALGGFEGADEDSLADTFGLSDEVD